MFIIITFHNSLNVYRMITAYVYQVPLEAAVQYIRNLDNWDAYALPLLLAILIWLADILAIYRCYLIWSHTLLPVALPILLLLASIGTHSVNLWWFGHRTARSIDEMQPLFNTTFPLHLAQNVLTTFLIAYKIWMEHQKVKRIGIAVVGGMNLMSVIRIFIESAALYTIEMLLAVIFFFARHPAQVIFQHALIPTTGIVFALLAIRVHTARHRDHGRNIQSSNSIIPSWLHGGEDNRNAGTGTASRRLTQGGMGMPIVTTVTEEHRLEDITTFNRHDSGSDGKTDGNLTYDQNRTTDVKFVV
ncbi:hypothetical protein CC1G_06988 [Coprinopsis cinerea okayama7|uniref:Integral membrane protein n=1 Tax=Coprinopsis cinerea (strain Okayama-7 / 130 / ATCC MYA-4618 / FGSC 9003) TaxID=240176 RepID=A8NAT5_COPC7|nr:hypothetical protein CC1G_06988 [Coprinopsis cinerea okayama7\|eukprot:XP_001831937.2 hypothetical protein CC1G_06988 [Coprinopsis cinerea okayama7\